jgi:hypothetical protein
MPPSDFDQSSLVDSLQRVDHFLAQVADLPDSSAFAETVETNFWETVTGRSDPPAEIYYTELPDVARSLIGRYDGDDGPIDPWWLREFTWTATFGGESIELRGEGLETFANNFDRDRTVIHKPELVEPREETRILATIEALKEIGDVLSERIDPDPINSQVQLPTSLFTVSEGLVEVTPEFDTWIDRFMSLLPGTGAEATALYLAHTGTSTESLDSAIDGELREQVRRLQLGYDSNRTPELVRQFDTILDMSMVFNRQIPSSSDRLSGLQYQLYRGFLESAAPSGNFVEDLFERAMRRTPPKIDPGEGGIFTRAACGTPLILYNRRPKLMSVGMYSPKTSGSSGYSSTEYRNLKDLFEAAGWFDDG